MLIQLQCDVRIDRSDGSSFVLRRGQYANYSALPAGDDRFEHVIHALDPATGRAVLRRELLPKRQNPEYL